MAFQGSQRIYPRMRRDVTLNTDQIPGAESDDTDSDLSCDEFDYESDDTILYGLDMDQDLVSEYDLKACLSNTDSHCSIDQANFHNMDDHLVMSIIDQRLSDLSDGHIGTADLTTCLSNTDSHCSIDQANIQNMDDNLVMSIIDQRLSDLSDGHIIAGEVEFDKSLMDRCELSGDNNDDLFYSFLHVINDEEIADMDDFIDNQNAKGTFNVAG